MSTPKRNSRQWLVTATYNNELGQPVLTYSVALPKLLDALQAVQAGLDRLGATGRGYKVRQIPAKG